MKPERRSQTSAHAALMGLLLLALFARAGAIRMTPDGLTGDPDGYRRYGESLRKHHDFLRGGKPSAWRPPLYPLLLAGCLELRGSGVPAIALLHALSGAATVWVVWLIARRWNLGSAANFAALLVAVDPLLVHESTQVMTETIAALLAAAAMLAATVMIERPRAWRAIAAGFTIGLAVLCRPTFLAWGACMAPLVGWGADRVYRARRSVLYLAGLAVALAPWAIRNGVELGRPVITTTHGGYTLLLGNNAYFYEFLKTRKPGQIWNSSPFVADWENRRKRAKIENEIDEDRFAYRLAAEIMRADKLAFARACLYRVTSFWRLAPREIGPSVAARARIVRLAITFWYFFVFAAALLGLLEFQRQHVPHTWMVALVLAFSIFAVHTVYWCDMRMRSPAMPAVALFAAAGARWLGEFRRRRSSAVATT